MILIDPRAGSGELAPYFRPYDVPTESMQLDAADFAFFGEGPDGMEMVGFERKVLGDFIQSKRDHRLHGFQLPKMSEIYPNFSHLIIEGIWRVGSTGLVEVRYGKEWRATKPTMAYREMDHFLAELEYKRGVYVKLSSSREMTVAYVVSRYKFFNDQVWSQHNRTEKVYAPCNPVEGASGKFRRGGFTRRTVPVLEKQLMQVDGVEGDAYWVARQYGNMERFMGVTVEELSEVPVERNTKSGRKMGKLGPAKAMKLWRAVREL